MSNKSLLIFVFLFSRMLIFPVWHLANTHAFSRNSNNHFSNLGHVRSFKTNRSSIDCQAEVAGCDDILDETKPNLPQPPGTFKKINKKQFKVKAKLLYALNCIAQSPLGQLCPAPLFLKNLSIIV
jgi:hypothetical protein